MIHAMTLGYTTDDDGIHLTCVVGDCHTDVLLGFGPTVGAVIEAYADHQKTISTTEQGVPA